MASEGRYELLKLILEAFTKECDEAITNINQMCRQANDSVEGMKLDGKAIDFAKYWQSFDDICDLIQKKSSLVRNFNIAHTESMNFSLIPNINYAGAPSKSFDDLVNSVADVSVSDMEFVSKKLEQHDMYTVVENGTDVKENKNILVKTQSKPDVIKNINSIIKGDITPIQNKSLPKKTENDNQPNQALKNNGIRKDESKSTVAQTTESIELQANLNSSIDLSFETSKNSTRYNTSTDSNAYKPRSKIPDVTQLTIGKEIPVKILDVLSPDEFYVSVGSSTDIEAMQAALKKMNKFYLGFTGNPFFNKETARGKLRDKICVVKHNDVWKRVRVIDWKLEPRSNDIVGVQFCDFGGTDYVRYTWLRELNPDYIELPQQTATCYLYNLKPFPKSWSVSSIKLLKNLKGVTAIAKEVKRGVYGVELLVSSKSFNKFLVSSEVAAYQVSPETNGKDSSMMSTSDGPIKTSSPKLSRKSSSSNAKKQEESATTDSHCRLTREEVKALDDCVMVPENTITDPNIAVMGHAPQDEKNACKFYNTPGGCFKKICTKEHVFFNPDGWTRDKTPVTNFVFPKLIIPPQGTMLDVRVTHVSDINKFFGTILKPYVSRGVSAKQDLVYKSASELCQFLNRPEVADNLKPLTYMPAPTELVIARYSVDNWFYRARIIDILENGYYAVEYVDYGNTAKVKDTDLRQFSEEFTDIPFQAIKFVIGNVILYQEARKNTDAMEKIRKVLLHKTVHCQILNVEDAIIRVSVRDSNGFDISTFLEALRVARIVDTEEAK